jgi:hypothetical protein
MITKVLLKIPFSAVGLSLAARKMRVQFDFTESQVAPCMHFQCQYLH